MNRESDRPPDSGTVAETETVAETVTEFTRSRPSSRTPDPGPRPPDSGTVAEAETVAVTVTESSSRR